MKWPLIALCICLFLTSALYGQSEALAKKVPKGSKVFVTSPRHSTARYSAKLLRKWSYWTIVQDKQEADFTINVVINKRNILSKYGASADISDKKNEVVYNIKEVNTWFSFWFNFNFSKKRAAVSKLIRMRIIAGHDKP